MGDGVVEEGRGGEGEMGERGLEGGRGLVRE